MPDVAAAGGDRHRKLPSAARRWNAQKGKPIAKACVQRLNAECSCEVSDRANNKNEQ